MKMKIKLLIKNKQIFEKFYNIFNYNCKSMKKDFNNEKKN